MTPNTFGGYQPTRTLQEQLAAERNDAGAFGSPCWRMVVLMNGFPAYEGPEDIPLAWAMLDEANQHGERFEVWELRTNGAFMLMDGKWDYRAGRER